MTLPRREVTCSPGCRSLFQGSGKSHGSGPESGALRSETYRGPLETGLESVEAAVGAFAANPREKEAGETQVPDADQQRQHEGARIAVSQGPAAGDDREVGEAPCQVEVALGLSGLGMDEDQPGEGEAEGASQG